MDLDKKLLLLSSMIKKFSINESAFIKKLSRLDVEDFLKQAAKIDVLTKKFGIPENVAEYLTDKTGKLAVWFADQLIKDLMQVSNQPDRLLAAKSMTIPFVSAYSEFFTLILDWLRHPQTVGINIREFTLNQAIEKAEEFHNNLETSGGDVDYEELNEKIIEYADGYYWAKINDGYSKEEGDRMGHCGRSGYSDTLFSLRSNTPYGKGHTINDSHVTVAYNSETGKISQAKGKKNSKPAAKYFKYLYNLISELPLFQGFNSEYESASDYRYQDMSNDEMLNLERKHPTAFSDLSGQKFLYERKLIKKITYESITVNIDVNHIPQWINLNYYDVKFIGKILNDNLWEYYDTMKLSSFDIKYALENISAEIYDKITNILKLTAKMPEESETVDFIMDNYNSAEVQKIITQVELAIINATANASAYASQQRIKSCFEHYGKVNQLSYDGIQMTITAEPFVKELGIDLVTEIIENAEGDLENALYTLLSSHENKPIFTPDESAYPDQETINNEIEAQLDVL